MSLAVNPKTTNLAIERTAWLGSAPSELAQASDLLPGRRLSPLEERVLQSAKEKFFKWLYDDCNTLGQGDDTGVAAKVKKLAQEFSIPTVDMKLCYHRFRRGWGFNFYYGKRLNGGQFVPLSIEDGSLASWQFENAADSAWCPVKDPKTNTWFIPRITDQKTVGPPLENATTGQYLRQTAHFPTPEGYRILEALEPYTRQINKHCDQYTIDKIKKLFPRWTSLRKCNEIP